MTCSTGTAEPSDDDPGSDDERGDCSTGIAGPGSRRPRSMEDGDCCQLAEWAQRHAEPADSKAKALVERADRDLPPGRRLGRASGSSSSPSTRPPRTGSPGCWTRAAWAGTGWACCSAAWTSASASTSRPRSRPLPDRDPVRILLATDAASEGIDLQRHCHRVIHYDIPFNPNRLEQRIGRVDRHGQRTR